MMIKNTMHLRQHMDMGPLLFTVIWDQLLFYPTQANFKLFFWIKQLQIWVALMMIWMLHHVTKKWGETVLPPFFCTFPNVSLPIKQNVLQQHLFAKVLLKSLYSRLGFKAIGDFAISPNFEKASNWFHYESGNTKHRKIKTGLRCYLSIPRRVTVIYDSWID